MSKPKLLQWDCFQDEGERVSYSQRKQDQLGLGCSSEALSSQLGFGAVAHEGGCLRHEMLSHCKRNASWLPPASVVPFLAAKQCGERANFLMVI